MDPLHPSHAQLRSPSDGQQFRILDNHFCGFSGSSILNKTPRTPKNCRIGLSLQILVPAMAMSQMAGVGLASVVPFVKQGSVGVEPGAERLRRLAPRAAADAGLGTTLREVGFEVAERVVVDENHTVYKSGRGNVIEKLMDGFKDFKQSKFKQKPEVFEPLKAGQAPEVMIIACADSRVCPTMLHGLEAGEAFIVRSVANLVPPFQESVGSEHHGTGAAVQYAVTALGVKKVIVMGHSSCGGIKALMTMDNFSRDFVGTWMQIGLPAKEVTLAQMGDKPLPEQCSFCEQEAVNVSLNNLLTFPFVEERVRKGELELYGMHYDFHDGKLTSWKAAPSMAAALPTVKYITSTTW